ncbi:DJ-1/PfpI family protein [Pseudomonas asplenii]|uniref:Transcriptional regulator containing an amidase domain and an AraC-type DNA-binding HTH domain n=1 Tax=Pseudomonas asplenii TaxID=53407 RepID=A0A0N0E1G4_9PSED|nr:DJ-1/PfpI family protein [Pseudomonas fuscovaginae]KPA87659.1 transcriptional regulator containing an amidase domain and an AraC-type DNA-binding HTH domain [Pseudomonas fuscovaginae]KPA99123.1 transcriptional regulator containing an amidase domain and an AraC-type DNA-binding HTH domain [Pseudomonas fuscovaginae]
MTHAHRSAIVVLALGLLLLVACSVPSHSESPKQVVRDDVGRLIQVPAPKPGRSRPLAVVLADNAGTETTDFLVPYGVLKESGVMEVIAVSTRPGRVKLMPALEIQAQMTTAEFDLATPEGADILVVPAMHRADDPALLAWVRKQASAGARIVSICDGAWVLANAGLLRDRVATSHWYSLASLKRQYPDTTWVQGRRYVADRNVMTTTGVSASIPASLALVEAVAGRSAADVTARRLGVDSWGPAHDSSQFKLTTGLGFVALANLFAFWRDETVEVPVEEGYDEIALALTADAWSRTYRSHALASSTRTSVHSRHGLLLLPEVLAGSGQPTFAPHTGAAAGALDLALEGIASRYGAATADFVALQLEYVKK